MQIGVITNPNSRKNRNRPDRAERLQRIVGSLGEVHETSSVESIKPVLRDFLRKQARYWVADGGDGALHWMLRMGMEVLQEDEFVDQSVTLPMTLPTKGGTIDFVANNVGIEGDAEGILAMLRRGVEGGTIIEETEVDSMVIDGEQLVDGTLVPFRTYGFASAAGGIGQRFYSKYYEHADPNPRTIVKVVANTVAYAMLEARSSRWLALGAGCLAIFVPTILEWTGTFGSSYVFHDGTFTIVPHALSFPKTLTFAYFTMTSLGCVLAPFFFVGKLRAKLYEMQRTMTLQAWQFRQLVPEEVQEVAGASPLPR